MIASGKLTMYADTCFDMQNGTESIHKCILYMEEDIPNDIFKNLT